MASARRISSHADGRRGTRPRAPRDQRTEWAYIFGAICREGERRRAGHALVRHRRHGGAHRVSPPSIPAPSAVLIVDQAGWHLTPKLAIPDNITAALPPRSPELNPVENVWQFIDNWLSNRIFKSYEDCRAGCQAWNNLIDQPCHVPRHAQMGAWVLINDSTFCATAASAYLLGYTNCGRPSYSTCPSDSNARRRRWLFGVVPEASLAIGLATRNRPASPRDLARCPENMRLACHGPDIQARRLCGLACPENKDIQVHQKPHSGRQDLRQRSLDRRSRTRSSN